jgi:hypothetical protein
MASYSSHCVSQPSCQGALTQYNAATSSGTLTGGNDKVSFTVRNDLPQVCTMVATGRFELVVSVWVEGNLRGTWICPYRSETPAVSVRAGKQVRVTAEYAGQSAALQFHARYGLVRVLAASEPGSFNVGGTLVLKKEHLTKATGMGVVEGMGS